jgi:hypothetical protein
MAAASNPPDALLHPQALVLLPQGPQLALMLLLPEPQSPPQPLHLALQLLLTAGGLVAGLCMLLTLLCQQLDLQLM